MDLRDILSKFENVQGGGGKYTARCPVHGDKRNSLGISEGDDGRTLIHCYVGCAVEDIVAAVGLTMKDLAPPGVDKKENKGAPKNKKTTRRAVKEPFCVGGDYYSSRVDEDTGKKQSVRETITNVYNYQDADGRAVVVVARTDSKSFPVQYLDDDGKWYYGRGPWAGLLYRLPDVLAAIRDGRPVFVVEGEKDADNLAALWYCATCNMGGGGKGKWGAAATEALRGADVYIIPDNDEPGQVHAAEVARALNGVAKSVRVIDLAQAMPELPLKGDITDYLKAQGGAKAAKAALDALVGRAKAGPEPDSQPDAPMMTDAERIFQGTGYAVMDGCLSRITNDGHVKLCSFAAAPVEEILKDDGVDAEIYMRVVGWDRHGHALPELVLSAAEYDAMAWPLRKWGSSGNIKPGTSTKRVVLHAMTSSSELYARRCTVYNHTGWREIGGKWVYLHRGGAIGADDVSVELSGPLSDYDLSCDPEADVVEACTSSLRLMGVAPLKISMPLLGLMYLAPLCEFLEESGHVPTFLLYVNGQSGTMKSTIASLAMSHLGRFGRTNPPANFHDTSNAIRGKAFALKDSVLMVDDYHPVGSINERRVMEKTMQDIARAFGDRAARGTMNVDRSIRDSQPPRGLALVTGEEVPNIGTSGVARMYVVDMAVGDIKSTEDLSEMQELARKGALRRAMSGYIEWLGGRADGLGAELASKYVALRKKGQALLNGAHLRTGEAAAHLMLGFGMMLDWAMAIGAITEYDAAAFEESAWAELIEGGREQAAAAEDGRPALMFVRALSEMVSADAVAFRSRSSSSASDLDNMAGWRDRDNYYLLPEVCYGLICRFYSQQGVTFPILLGALLKQLREDGLILTGSGGKSTKVIRELGKSVRVAVMPRVVLDGEDPKREEWIGDVDKRGPEQEKMEV